MKMDLIKFMNFLIIITENADFLKYKERLP